VSEGGLRDHMLSLAARLHDEVLPPHHPGCLGCGPDSPHGFHLEVRREGDEVVTEHTFTARLAGAPGIAHGGAVATVVDDLLGFLLYVAVMAGVTRRLEVDYLKPVLLDTPYVVRGRVDRREGRKLFVSCEGAGPDGVVAFRGQGLFIAVGLSHFAEATTSGDGQDPVAP
jgi:acyl-coenzyme A thioesterase PaaI-like protein